MKSSATIIEKWKLCIIAWIFGSILLIISYIRYNQSNTNLTMYPSIIITQTPADKFPNDKENSKNITLFQEKLGPAPSPVEFPPTDVRVSINEPNVTEKEECYIFNGNWVYNPETNPLYFVLQCPFLSEQVSCQNNGRPDFEYEHWSWEAQGKGCEIPRFDAKDMLERLRGKRLIIVGDSLNRNQWESLACLLYSALSPSRTFVDVTSSLYKVFRAEDYNTSVEFHWSPFLVHLYNNKEKRAVLKLDEIDPSAKNWEGADIMVFNSGRWWLHPGKIKAWSVFEYKGQLIDNMEIESAMGIAMRTWADWVDTKIDTRKTRVFFRSMSAPHFGEHICYGRLDPLTREEYSHIQVPKLVGETIQRTLGSLKTQVQYMDITKLTQFRIDAHPGVFAMKQGQTHPDCSHWCLPGVPDTWNRLLYASLVRDKSFIDGQNATDLPVLQETEKPFHDSTSKTAKQVLQPTNDVPDQKFQATETPETYKEHATVPDEKVSQPSADILGPKISETEEPETSDDPLSKPDSKSSQEDSQQEECDIFEGRWVYEQKSGPLYVDSECPFINEKFRCQSNGRPDFDYLKWSWEATGCRIPKFDGKDMLERLRGKRLVMVGDSINRSQWESLACLLFSALPPSENRAKAHATNHIFKAVEYDFSLEYYWSPFLVEQELNANGSTVLRLDTISSTSQHWLGADILVFNTGHWWDIGVRHQRWDALQYRRKIINKMTKETAFKVAIKTWSRWIDTNVDSTRTRVFFRSYSPTHSCYEIHKPLMGDRYLRSPYPKFIFEMMEKTMRGMETPVEYLNVTKLSQYRADAHTSFYSAKQDGSWTTSKKRSNADCSHWCLPGLPDTWNMLFYASLLRPRQAQNSRGFVEPKKIELLSNSLDEILKPDSKATNKEKCNIFEGKWVYDPLSRPPYADTQCPFMNIRYSCQLNGRPDFEYVKWRWEAKDCQILMLNVTDMLERLRGKRVIFVGDSLNNNQYQSMVCLLYSVLPASQAKLSAAHDHLRVEEYDLSVENYWSPFFVQIESGSKTLRLDTISDTAEKWKDADIMVFNSAHWWGHGKTIRVWENFEHNGEVIDDMQIESAYEAALKTWAHWIDTNVDSKKTRVFFRSVSPVHIGKQTCVGKFEPLKGNEYLNVTTYPKSMRGILESTIEGMKTPVTYLNITKLSQFRADAHSSYYYKTKRRLLRARRKHRIPNSKPEQSQSFSEQRAFIPEQPQSISETKTIPKKPDYTTEQTQNLPADCNHWCLPGVPDTWNRLLYASIVLESSGDNSKAY